MAKYSPKTKEELEQLVSDESVNLGDIDTSAITDMSNLFEGSDREDFSGIEKWDFSNVENVADMFLGMAVDIASKICEQFKKAYVVEVDEDDIIIQIISEYSNRLEATWWIKNKRLLIYGRFREMGAEYLSAIGYQPDINFKDLEELVTDDSLGIGEVDLLLRNCVRKAVAVNIDENYCIDKLLGIYDTRLEAVDSNKKGENETLFLGYQPSIKAETFIGRKIDDMRNVLQGLRWLTWGGNCFWWVEIDKDNIIAKIVKGFYDEDEANEYESDLPNASEGNSFELVSGKGMWDDDDECDDDDDWDDDDEE